MTRTTEATDPMTTYVALLRGVNVGGNNMIRMADLKTSFEEIGFAGVKTFINSGNVVFRTEKTDPRKLEKRIEKQLKATLSYLGVVVVRSLDEIQELIDRLPEGWQTATDLRCNVLFLRQVVDEPAILDGFAPRAGVDEVFYHPGAVFWSTTLEGLTRSGMQKIVGKPVYQDITIRNLNTTRSIHALMLEAEQ